MNKKLDTKKFDNLENRKRIDGILKSIKGVDGTPISLLIPYDAGARTNEMLAMGFKQLASSKVDLIVILIPKKESESNNFESNGFQIFLDPQIETPLGRHLIDLEIAEYIKKKLQADQIKECEKLLNDINPLLPFIKKVAPDSKVIVCLIGTAEVQRADLLGKMLARDYPEKSIVLVVLTNLDKAFFNEIEFFDTSRIKGHFKSEAITKNITLAPVITAMDFASQKEGNTYTTLVQYPEKSETDKNNIFLTTGMFWKYNPPNLNLEQKNKLIEIGFSSIREFIVRGEIPPLVIKDNIFTRKAGAFLTLKQGANLRGCIGCIKADKPLVNVVQNVAISAAISDPRFPPIRLEELDTLSMKISILSPLKRIQRDQIEIGKHGLLFSYCDRHGVLLPQVASERNWDVDAYLKHLAWKAGLDNEIWKENPPLYAFTTITFGSS